MLFQILDNAKKKKLVEFFSYLGLNKVPYTLIKTGGERIRAYSGELSQQEINQLWELLPIEGIGLYFGKQILERKNGRMDTRLSVDALHMLKDLITKNTLGLNDEQKEAWFRGEVIQLNKEQQEELKEINDGEYLALKYGHDFIGSGKLGMGKTIVSNFLPKERRVKN